ncbi:MAG: sulfotransferase family protein [Sphingomonas sp.]|uniref:tetratricopeptide repeat-containing sulfotransferase family protein n=1 Tax=Sphingomonas sp. TaxID=28214 RepID=UPI00120CFC36|nr:sulfotransferase [Sphingomonas sp.]THD36728.1 MAG: sulfotransferase family protein [Sphingomonas sp.]
MAVSPQSVPDDHSVAVAHARQLTMQGRSREAEDVCREVLSLDPGNGIAHGMLGMRLSERESLVAGAWHLRRAIEIEGRHPELFAALGHNLIRQGQVDEAEPLLREASAAMPEALLPRAHHAVALERLGRRDEAWAVFATLKADAARTRQDVTGQEALLWEGSPNWRDGLEALDRLATPTQGATQLTRGRLRDKAGNYAGAWADFVEGKRRVAEENKLSYDRAGVAGHLKKLQGFFTAERMAGLPRATVRGDVPQPIFVLGFPRSGTTMTEQLLTSHPAIRAGDELPFTGELVEFAAGQTGRFPDGLASLAGADRRHLVTLFRDFYLARAEQYGLLAPGAQWFTDKMPLNDIYLPLLHLAFPQAKVILVRRHPLDILVSVMGHNLTHGFNCGFDPGTAAAHLALVSDAMQAWRVAGIPFHDFSYEAFVRDQEGETQRLMAYIGVEVDPAQHRFHENKRLAPTPSYGQVRQPLYDKSIGRWCNYREMLAPVVPTVADALRRGGYSVME